MGEYISRLRVIQNASKYVPEAEWSGPADGKPLSPNESSRQ
jgi:hypothetical protein